MNLWDLFVTVVLIGAVVALGEWVLSYRARQIHQRQQQAEDQTAANARALHDLADDLRSRRTKTARMNHPESTRADDPGTSALETTQRRPR